MAGFRSQKRIFPELVFKFYFSKGERRKRVATWERTVYELRLNMIL